MLNTLEILKNHALSVTQARVTTLEYFFQKNEGISQPEIEKGLSPQFDRTTIYRTLNSFVEKGIIHKVIGADGATKFALHHHDNNCSTQSHHHDEHIHFTCTKCDKTLCMKELFSPNYHSPQGFVFKSINVMVEGICESCNKV